MKKSREFELSPFPPRVQPGILPLSFDYVRGKSRIWLVGSPVCVFRPTFLIIPEYIGRNVSVTSIRNGAINMLIGDGGFLDGFLFRETLPSPLRISLDYDTLVPGNEIMVELYNHSKSKLRVNAHFEGFYPKERELNV